MTSVSAGRPLVDLVKLCYAAKRPILLVGRHGVGKSEILQAAATEMGIGCLPLDLSLLEAPDLTGLPHLDEGVTRYFPPAFLPVKGKGLLVFEELNRCPRYVRAPTLQLLTARCLNQYRLPSGWLPVAAINPEDSYDVDELDEALRSRFVQVEVRADHKQFLDWACRNRVHRDVIGYVASDRSIFSHPQSNPRAWKYVSDLLNAAERKPCPQGTLWAAIDGLVGPTRAAAFRAYLNKPARPLGAKDILLSYPSYRDKIRTWIQTDQLDLVRGSLLNVLKFLQPPRDYKATRKRPSQWKRLATFLRDLPTDLKKEAKKFFAERKYELPCLKGKS
jgi:hypothetical protein